jgi:transposase
MHRGDLTDAQYARLEPLLPPPRPPKGSKGGRPRNDDRTIINGILWILRTGAPWPDLPARYGPPSTVSTRLYRWKKAGIWDRIFAAVQAEADAHGELDWETHHVDATVIRAHQHAAGAKKGTQQRKHLAAAKADSAPKSTSASRARASRSPSS